MKEYFKASGIDYDSIFAQIRGIVVKTMISAQVPNVNGVRNNVEHASTCYELFGFDILLDANLKPWLMEVNISPSLKTSCEIDQEVKSRLIVDVFNLVGYSVKDMEAYRLHHRNKYVFVIKAYPPD